MTTFYVWAVSAISIIFLCASVREALASKKRKVSLPTEAIALADTNSTSDRSLSHRLGNVCRFIGLWAICFTVSVLLAAYSGYGEFFGITAPLRLFANDNVYEFPLFAYMASAFSGLIGAMLLSFRIKNKTILYTRIILWFFPAGALALLLGCLVDPGIPLEGHAWDGMVIILSLPLFVMAFIVAYLLAGLTHWLFGTLQ